jgi:hypothetical protein
MRIPQRILTQSIIYVQPQPVSNEDQQPNEQDGADDLQEYEHLRIIEPSALN